MALSMCSTLLAALIFILASRVCSGLTLAPAPAPASSNDSQPESFKYTQLWSDADGETHVAECKMGGFKLQIYSSLPQFVKDDFGGNPTKIVLTELSVGLSQPLHSAPAVQFVTTLSGSWYINTTDGSYREFLPGQVLFQDNLVTSPAAKAPQHFSGAVGDVPCQQLIVQFNRTPEVNHVCPF